MLTEMQEARLDRAVGAIVGSAVGDALGAPLEFTAPRRDDGTDWIRDLVGGGAFGWKPGETTDDTAMMRCILEMYLENNGRYDQDLLVTKFLNWYESRPPDVGSWTRAALQAWISYRRESMPKSRKVEGTAGYKSWYRSHNPVLDLYRSSKGRHASNGGVMRCIPTALIQVPSMDRMLVEAGAICEDTHPAPQCIASCQAVVWMAAKLIRDLRNKKGTMRGNHGTYSMQEVWVDVMANTVQNLGVPELYVALRSAPTLPWGAWTNGGSAIATTQCAFAVLLQAESFEEGLVAVVNRGNDADTVGAVAGALLGARFGYSSIPKRWLERLQGHSELRKMAADLWLLKRRRI